MYFFFRWRYSPLWVFACQTIPLHFSLSFTNSLHLLTPSTWRSLSTFYLTLHTVLQELEDSLQLPKLYLVLFRPLSLNVSSLFLCSTFVTINFYCVGLLAPCQTWRTRVSLFVWVITLDLSGMGGPTSSIRYRQHSSQDHVTTQAPPLRQSWDTFGEMH